MHTVIRRGEAAQTVAVNGVVIANADIAREVQNHASSTPGQAWQEATRALVVRELLLQRARSLNLVAEPMHEAGDAKPPHPHHLDIAISSHDVDRPPNPMPDPGAVPDALDVRVVRVGVVGNPFQLRLRGGPVLRRHAAPADILRDLGRDPQRHAACSL